MFKRPILPWERHLSILTFPPMERATGSNTGSPEPDRLHRTSRRGRLRNLLRGGCLLVLAGATAMAWATTRALRTPANPDPRGTLLWDEALGRHSPDPTPPASTPLGAPVWDITSSEVLSVSDAVEMGDVWVLLDSRRGSLHFLELNSGRIRSVGRSGPGPGEFRDPVAVAAGDSTIGVLNHRGLFLDEYSLDGGFLRRTRLQGGGCLVGLMKGLSMVAGRDPLLMRICPALVPGPGTAWIERIGPDGNLTPVLSLPLGRAGSGRLHLLRQPAFRAGDHLLFLGTWDAPCISAFSREGEVHRPFCLPDYPRPRTPDAEKSALERRLEKVTALGLLPIRVPDVLPWYDAFFVTSRGIAVRRIRSSEERDIVLLHLEGGASVAQGILPRTTHVGEESILSIEDVLRGSRIRVHANPWR